MVVKILVLMSFGVPIISAAAAAYKRASGLTYGESLYKVGARGHGCERAGPSSRIGVCQHECDE